MDTVEDTSSGGGSRSCATLDVNLENYISGYAGTTKALRLRFIATKFSDPLQQEANNLLASELKKGLNLEMLQELSQTAQLNPHDAFDEEWANKVSLERRRGIADAETNLSHAKSSANKENIRRGHMELGDIYVEHGDLAEAINCYRRSRDYFSKPEHAVETYSKIAVSHIDCMEYGKAEAVLYKLDGATMSAPSKSHISITRGLLSFHKGEYNRACRYFLEVDGTLLIKNSGDITTLANSIRNVMTISDVSIYCCFCALVSFDVSDIKRLLLDSKTFKPILEYTSSLSIYSPSVPSMRELMTDFINSDYNNFLKKLNIIKTNLYYDMYIYKHIDKLVEIISDKVIIQYCKPYTALDIKRMAYSLNKNIFELEKDLARLIATGDIAFRIDTAKHELLHKIQNDRDVTIEKVAALNEMHASSIKQGILRLSLLEHQFSVVPDSNQSKKRDASSSHSSGTTKTSTTAEFAASVTTQHHHPSRDEMLPDDD